MGRNKYWLTWLLSLLLLAGCAPQATDDQSGTTAETIEQEVQTVLEYTAHYVRTDGFYYYEDEGYPCVFVVDSVEEGRKYYANMVPHDLDDTDEPVASTGVLKSMVGQEYTEEFFASNYLIYVVLEEPSGSIRHEVEAVGQTADGQLQVSVNTIVPEVGTDDMAQWHIILELSRDAGVADAEDVLVYLDGTLAYDGAPVEPEVQPVIYTKPPKGLLYHPSGTADLLLGGYSWTSDNGDGTTETVIADSLHPLQCKELLEPVSFTGDYVKLDFPEEPNGISGVQVRCWPDTAWDRTDTPAETVNAYETAFDVKPGGYVYEISITWEAYGTVSYLAYIVAQ